MVDKEDTVDAAMFVAEKGQSSKNTADSNLFTIVIKVKADKEKSSGFTVDSAEIMDNREQITQNTEDSAEIMDNREQITKNTEDSAEITKAHEKLSCVDAVDAGKLQKIMDNREQITKNTEDSAEITKAHEKLSCVDAVDAGKLQMETTSSLVRAEPTVQDSEDECRYQMNFPCIGVCLIINNKYFEAMYPRIGTDVDEAALKKMFEALGYKVIVHKDLSKKKMKEELEKVSKEDHSGNASFICVILSHGKEEGICGTDGIVSLEKLTRYFKGDECRSLVGKPKLFFLQACRGENFDSGTMDRDMVDATALPITQKIPVEADFLYAYATAPGYYAWRNVENGSWFIQSLCEILPKYKHLELMQIMTRVNRKVANEFLSSSNKAEFDGKKAISCFTSMLTKEFYFPV